MRTLVTYGLTVVFAGLFAGGLAYLVGLAWSGAKLPVFLMFSAFFIWRGCVHMRTQNEIEDFLAKTAKPPKQPSA